MWVRTAFHGAKVGYIRKLTVPVPPKPSKYGGEDYGMGGGFGGADQ